MKSSDKYDVYRIMDNMNDEEMGYVCGHDNLGHAFKPASKSEKLAVYALVSDMFGCDEFLGDGLFKLSDLTDCENMGAWISLGVEYLMADAIHKLVNAPLYFQYKCSLHELLNRVTHGLKGYYECYLDTGITFRLAYAFAYSGIDEVFKSIGIDADKFDDATDDTADVFISIFNGIDDLGNFEIRSFTDLVDDFKSSACRYFGEMGFIDCPYSLEDLWSGNI